MATSTSAAVQRALIAVTVLVVGACGASTPGRASDNDTTAGRAFQAAGGRIFCKLDDEVPENPFLACWRPLDGRVVSIEHAAGQPGRTSVDASYKGKAPRYPALASGRTWVWRCQKVNAMFVRLCSATRGKIVLICWSNRTDVRCENRDGHGFVLARSRTHRVF